jgi:hypothetical protein
MRCYPLLLVFALTGCIGQPLAGNSASGPSRAEIYAQAENEYDSMFLGKSVDVPIRRYGTPSRTATLADGTKILEYKSRIRYVHQDKSRDEESCLLRFLTSQNQITRIDSVGDKNVCIHFAATGKRDDFMDYRKNPGWEFEPR